MSRTFKIDSPGKIRNQLMRTCAEVIRHLSQKTSLDDEAKDMAALLVYCLRQIAEGIDESSVAWEKRDYWLKAERFRQKWEWTARAATDLEALVRDQAWDRLPATLSELYPHFADIKITKLTRHPSLWQGAFERLIAEAPAASAQRNSR